MSPFQTSSSPLAGKICDGRRLRVVKAGLAWEISRRDADRRLCECVNLCEPSARRLRHQRRLWSERHPARPARRRA